MPSKKYIRNIQLGGTLYTIGGDGYNIEISANPGTTSGTLTQEQYEGLAGDKNSYIIFKQNGLEYLYKYFGNNGSSYIFAHIDGGYATPVCIYITDLPSGCEWSLTTSSLMTTGTSQTITGLKTFQDSGSGALSLKRIENTYSTYLHPTSTTLTRNIDIYLPEESGPLMSLNGDQTVSGTKKFMSGLKLSSDGDNGELMLDMYDSTNKNLTTVFGVSFYLNDKGYLILGDDEGTECSIQLKGSEGAAGQVLTSQGSGKTPSWTTVVSERITNITITKV